MQRFTGHDKRVTLQLARLSTAADQNQDFAAVLNELPLLGWDVNKLTQEGQEILFAEFDEELETRIKGEFVADPSYVVDLGHAMGICPLCGHVGCRYLFKIRNLSNDKAIECGSECILTHGLAVKGAETAEHARKALEATIRRHIKALKIEAWHKDMGFQASLFETLSDGLDVVRNNYDLPWKIRSSAYYKLNKDLPKLVKFYERSGWLNTEKRWAEWTRLVSFARKFNPHTRKVMSYPLPHGYKAGTAVELKDAAPEPIEAPKAETLPVESHMDEETADLEQQAADEAAHVAQQKTTTLPQPEQPFASIANELVFG